MKNTLIGASPNPSYEQPISSCGDNVNLFDLTNGENGGIDASGNLIVNNNNWRAIDFIKVKPNTTYTFSIDRSSLTRSSALRLYEYDSGKTFISPRKEIVNANLTITTGATTEYIKYTIYLDSVITTSEIIAGIKPKIEQGSLATPYSPYNQGVITEKIVNKNLALSNLYNTQVQQTGNIISILSRVSNVDSNAVSNLYLKAGTYTLSIQELDYCSLLTKNNNGDIIDNFATSWHTLPFTFTLTQNGYLYFTGRKADNSNINPSDYMPQLELGSTATDYVAHQEQNYSIYTQQPFRSIGTTRDVFIKKTDGKWYERHNVYRKIFDGTENWDVQWGEAETKRYGYRCDISNAVYPTSSDDVSSVKSNFYNTYTQNKLFRAYGHADFVENGICIRTNNSQTIIKNNDYTSLDSFKTYLATQYTNGTPVYADYILSTPNDILCTEEQTEQLEAFVKARTYKNVSHFYSEDEVSPYLELEYVRDLETVINNLSNAIVSLGGNV